MGKKFYCLEFCSLFHLWLLLAFCLLVMVSAAGSIVKIIICKMSSEFFVVHFVPKCLVMDVYTYLEQTFNLVASHNNILLHILTNLNCFS